MDYTKEEIDKRFKAALRGARVAGPKHRQIVTQKRAKAQRKKRQKT